MDNPQSRIPDPTSQVLVTVTGTSPLACTLSPDQPAYEACAVTVDYTDALLADLGPSLLMLYASYAGPPVTREALVEMVEPVVRFTPERLTREELLRRVEEGYGPVLARGRECVEGL